MKLSEILTEERKEVKTRVATYIHDPLILDIERGNMIRIKGQAAHPNWQSVKKDFGLSGNTWGTIVTDVNYKDQLILVGEFIGGSAQFEEWVSINDVEQTWNIGGWDRAQELLGAFGTAVDDNVRKRKEMRLSEIKVTKTMAGKQQKPTRKLAMDRKKKSPNQGKPPVDIEKSTKSAKDLSDELIKGEY